MNALNTSLTGSDCEEQHKQALRQILKFSRVQKGEHRTRRFSKLVYEVPDSQRQIQGVSTSERVVES